MVETTALGAAMLAGLGVGILDFNDVIADEITKFSPQIGDDGMCENLFSVNQLR